MDTYSFFFNGENGTPKWVKCWCNDNLDRKSQKLQVLLKFKPKKGTSSNCLLLLSVHSSFKNILLPFWHICELILPMNFCINSWWHFFRPILNLLCINIHLGHAKVNSNNCVVSNHFTKFMIKFLKLALFNCQLWSQI